MNQAGTLQAALSVVRSCMDYLTRNPSGDIEPFMDIFHDAIFEPSIDGQLGIAASAEIYGEIFELALKLGTRLETDSRLGKGVYFAFIGSQLISVGIAADRKESIEVKTSCLESLQKKCRKLLGEQPENGQLIPRVINALMSLTDNWLEAHQQAAAAQSYEPVERQTWQHISNLVIGKCSL